MKKLLMVIMIAITTVFASKAQEGYSICKISGTNDYVEGTAYLTLSGSTVSGDLVISNSSARPLQTASIKVSVIYTGTATKKVNKGHIIEEEPYTFEKTAIVYNSRWTGTIPAFQPGKVLLEKSLELPRGAHDVSIKEVFVSINNPCCINN